jgi:hypothetical protein
MVSVIHILGSEYHVEKRKVEDDSLLETRLGYCDPTDKKIVIAELTDDNCEMSNKENLYNRVLRHELIHAFLYESGLGDNINKQENAGHDEQMVDWIALQYPKIHAAFVEANVEC